MTRIGMANCPRMNTDLLVRAVVVSADLRAVVLRQAAPAAVAEVDLVEKGEDLGLAVQVDLAVKDVVPVVPVVPVVKVVAPVHLADPPARDVVLADLADLGVKVEGLEQKAGVVQAGVVLVAARD